VAEVTVSGHIQPQNGMVVNIVDLKAILEQEVVGPLDGQYLTTEHPLLARKIPSTETLARVIWDQLEPALEAAKLPARLESVLLRECRSLWAECTRDREGGKTPMVTFTRSYEFAAAHRLHSNTLSEDENRELFGKCNNPHGHGHNYVLEVTVGGEPDPATGFLIDLPLLDRVVHERVVDRYDHRHLNHDIEEFRSLNPTSENLVKVAWERLFPALPPGSLRRVTLRETERNIFIYEGK
jgi:6-pyruvoyltetrahydropterin/6-carboxytetrahydropterin synthase